MYKDRGIIKWAPFDSLSTFQEEISNLHYELDKVGMPVLSEDQLSTIDELLKEIIEKDIEANIVYYENGYHKNIYSKISKVDLLEDKLFISKDFYINLKDIIKLEII